MQESLNFTKGLNAVKNGWKLLVGMTILGALIAALLTYFLMTPIYRSEATLLVNQESRSSSSNDAQDLQTNLQSITTYASIAKLPDTLIPVIDKLDLNMQPEELAGSVETSAVPNSTLLTIAVTHPSQKQAAAIANEIANTMVKQDSLKLENLNVASKARVIPGSKPIEPTPVINIFVGATLGFLLSLIYLLSRSLMDMAVRTPEEVEQELGLSVIGNIPFIK